MMLTKMQRGSCVATIDLTRLRHNLALIQRKADGCEIMAMVKANAYGHGIIDVACALQKMGVRHFGVATFAEARALRKAGVGGTILMTGGATWLCDLEQTVALNLTPFLGSLDEIFELGRYLKQSSHQTIEVHIDLDTGMGRTGVVVSDTVSEDLAPVLGALKEFPQLKVVGLGSHFATADCDAVYANTQMTRFNRALEAFESQGFTPRILHIANSAAIFQGWAKGNKDLRAKSGDYAVWVRPGLALYGVSPLDGDGSGLLPVMRVDAPIVARKYLAKGSKVGYGSTFECERDTELALVRIGYADGFRRLLSNVGHVLVAKELCPVVGRVSMDLIAIDVTDAVAKKGMSSCELFANATMLGESGEHAITASALAESLETIPYEILTSIGERVERVFSSGV